MRLPAHDYVVEVGGIRHWHLPYLLRLNAQGGFSDLRGTIERDRARTIAIDGSCLRLRR